MDWSSRKWVPGPNVFFVVCCNFFFHLYMGPLVHLPNRDRFAACQSVRLSIRPERFPGIWRRMFGGNGHKSCMLMYLGHLQNWLDYGHGLLIFQILAPFDFVKRVKCEVSGHLPENAWREWPVILHVDVSGQLSGLVSLWSRFVDISNYGTTLT